MPFYLNQLVEFHLTCKDISLVQDLDSLHFGDINLISKVSTVCKQGGKEVCKQGGQGVFKQGGLNLFFLFFFFVFFYSVPVKTI